MKKLSVLLFIFILFSSHDMFLKMPTYFLDSGIEASIELFNGTFEKSDNTIDRNRMIDASIVGHGVRTRVDTSDWTDYNNVTILNFTTGQSGTWVAGVSTKARNIELEAEDFNEYLEHDGVLDMLDYRESNNELDSNAIEKYSKHVKTIFQVGENKTEDWGAILGYPIEFVPLSNPYELTIGDLFQVQLLRKGRPLADQLVYVGSKGHSHDHGKDDHSHDHGSDSSEEHHHDALQLRTDGKGVVDIEIGTDGHWYLRTIHMERLNEEGLTHESNWATLTFEVAHIHGSTFLYTYWIAGILIVILIVWALLRFRG